MGDLFPPSCIDYFYLQWCWILNLWWCCKQWCCRDCTPALSSGLMKELSQIPEYQFCIILDGENKFNNRQNSQYTDILPFLKTACRGILAKVVAMAATAPSVAVVKVLEVLICLCCLSCLWFGWKEVSRFLWCESSHYSAESSPVLPQWLNSSMGPNQILTFFNFYNSFWLRTWNKFTETRLVWETPPSDAYESSQEYHSKASIFAFLLLPDKTKPLHPLLSWEYYYRSPGIPKLSMQILQDPGDLP